jgi:hypothetical protein
VGVLTLVPDARYIQANDFGSSFVIGTVAIIFPKDIH